MEDWPRSQIPANIEVADVFRPTTNLTLQEESSLLEDAVIIYPNE